MQINEYILRNEGFYIAPEVKYACEFLERYGEILFVTFTIDNAVSKAAEIYSVYLDEDLSDWRAIRDRAIAFDEWREYHRTV